MPYATEQQLVTQYGLAEISQLVSDEETLITEALLRDALEGVDLDIEEYSEEQQAAVERALNRIQQVLKMQSSYMESKIGQRYPVPLGMTDDEINASPVLECCLALSRAALCDDDDNNTDDIKADRKHWRDWLDQIASGKAIIPGLTVSSSGTGSGGVVHRRITGQARSGIDWERF